MPLRHNDARTVTLHKPHRLHSRPWHLVGVMLGCALGWSSAFGAGFAARVSPPNFELQSAPGAVLREVIEILNGDRQTA